MSIMKRTEQKEIPNGFTSWLQFYDYFTQIANISPEDEVLRFIDKNNKEYRMKIETLKARCFDEIIEKRIPKQVGMEILRTYQNIHLHPVFYKKVEDMIDIMVLSE